MKQLLFFIFGTVLILGFMACSNKKAEALCCSEDIDTIKAEIKSKFNADSVIIYTKRLREEIYFPEMHFPIVVIRNATTNVLDFKTLPTTHYQGFNSFLQIENELRQEALPIAQNLINKCDMSKFNNLIIEFHKLNNEGKPMYRFICHYKDLLP
jgi:hypothetical protein